MILSNINNIHIYNTPQYIFTFFDHIELISRRTDRFVVGMFISILISLSDEHIITEIK